MTKPKSGFRAKIKAWWQATKWTTLATMRSIANLSIERYPEVQRDGKLADLTGENLVPELLKTTKKFDAIESGRTDPKVINEAIELAKASLEESKKQTEYQDNKASRLLTVTSFVSALSAALLASFSDRYPLGTLNPSGDKTHILLICAYVFFLLFSLFALCGALVTFHAIRTRFKYTSDEIVTNENLAPKSMLFHKGIIGTGPEGWVNSFVTENSNGGVIVKNNLKLIYLINYIIEAYLVAAKTADKIRYLAPAQALLAWAMRTLVVFVLLFAASVIFVPKSAPESDPSQVLIQSPSEPISVRLVPRPTPPVEPSTPIQAGKGE